MLVSVSQLRLDWMSQRVMEPGSEGFLWAVFPQVFVPATPLPYSVTLFPKAQVLLGVGVKMKKRGSRLPDMGRCKYVRCLCARCSMIPLCLLFRNTENEISPSQPCTEMPDLKVLVLFEAAYVNALQSMVVLPIDLISCSPHCFRQACKLGPM